MNLYEAEARTRKAYAIADVLQLVPVTADEAEEFTERLRRHAALAAQQRPASNTTWEQVVSILRHREQLHAEVLDAPMLITSFGGVIA